MPGVPDGHHAYSNHQSCSTDGSSTTSSSWANGDSDGVPAAMHRRPSLTPCHRGTTPTFPTTTNSSRTHSKPSAFYRQTATTTQVHHQRSRPCSPTTSLLVIVLIAVGLPCPVCPHPHVHLIANFAESGRGHSSSSSGCRQQPLRSLLIYPIVGIAGLASSHSGSSGCRLPRPLRSLLIGALLAAAYAPVARAEPRVYSMAGSVIKAPLSITTSMAPRSIGSIKSGRGSGFINQHLKLLTLLTLAIHLKVETVILPTATSRDSWEIAEPVWLAQPAESLWDVESIRLLLERHNISMTLASVNAEDPPRNSVILPTYFCRVVGIDFLAAEIDRHIHLHLSHLATRPQPVHPLTLYASELILSLHTEHIPLYAEVGRAVRFSPQLEAMADILTRKLRRLSKTPEFNGLHLRVEGDFREVHNMTLMQGLESYGDTIHSLNFSNSPLYIASAIFVEGGAVDVSRYAEVEIWLQQLKQMKHATMIANNQLLVHNDTRLRTLFLALHSEQRAALDFLVLMRSDQVVGTKMSSFSFSLRECRALRNIPRNTTGIVGGPWNLFVYAATFPVPA